MISRRLLLGAAAPLAAASIIRSAMAYPDRPIRMIVPFAAGGNTDILARLVAGPMAERLGRPIVIENRAGAGGSLGAELVARAPADGYTLLFGAGGPLTANPVLQANIPYDVERDFRPIGLVGILPMICQVTARLPARSLTELIALMRQRDGALTVATPGSGSAAHLALELLLAGANVKATHVPYRGGAPSVTDLAAGNLDFMVSNLPECMAQIQGGRLRPLAITSAARHPLVPDVPTVREAGSPELEMTNWTAMITNAAVPAPILAKLEADTLAAIRDAEVSRRARDGGFTVEAWDRARSAAYISAETDRWARLVQEAKLKAD